MTTTTQQLEEILRHPEGGRLEFKEAKGSFHFETLIKYAVALANEGGGKMVLGVTDAIPRRIVGTKAFHEIERTKQGLIEKVRLKIEVEELLHPHGRVLLFHIPSRPSGVAMEYAGAYWMRAGDSVRPMTPDMLGRIFAESTPDFSADICSTATVSDLEPESVARFRTLWRQKSSNSRLDNASDEQLLNDAELISDAGVTYAALAMLGSHSSLGRHLSQAEVIFEYRSSEATGPAQERKEFRQGFLGFLEELRRLINLRNDNQHFQDGLYIWDIPTFNESAVREAVLNAVAHRDYRQGGSIFIRQYPRRLEIVSPGGFLPGITPENVLWKQLPRNRRIAEALAKCGLVERAGQGFNRIFESCIKESKPRPDFSGTDDYQVFLSLHGQIQDENFLRFLEKVGRERLASFHTEDLLVLDLVHREQPVPEQLQPRLPYLIDQGVLERVNRGKSARHILSRGFYGFIGKKGVYTRKKGLDRHTNKELLLRHVSENAAEGTKLEELMQVLPSLSRDQVRTLVRELKKNGKIINRGIRKVARWFPCTSQATPQQAIVEHDRPPNP